MAQEQEWQTLSGTVENIVYCNEENGYTVLEFSSGGDLYTAVGELSDASVAQRPAYFSAAGYSESSFIASQVS